MDSTTVESLLDMTEDEIAEMMYPICCKKKFEHAMNLNKMVRHRTFAHYDSQTKEISNSYNNRHIDFTSQEDINLMYMQLCGVATCEHNELIYGQEDINFVAAKVGGDPNKVEIQKGLQCKQKSCNCWKRSCWEWFKEHKVNE